MKKKILAGILALGLALPVSANAWHPRYRESEQERFEAIKAATQKRVEKIIVTTETENNKYGRTEIKKIYSNGDSKTYYEDFDTKRYLQEEIYKTLEGEMVYWYSQEGEVATFREIRQKGNLKTIIDVRYPERPDERYEDRNTEEIMEDAKQKYRPVKDFTVAYIKKFSGDMQDIQKRMIQERHLLDMDQTTRARAEKVLSGTYRGTL